MRREEEERRRRRRRRNNVVNVIKRRRRKQNQLVVWSYNVRTLSEPSQGVVSGRCRGNTKRPDDKLPFLMYELEKNLTLHVCKR